jgi:hypothetical protein
MFFFFFFVFFFFFLFFVFVFFSHFPPIILLNSNNHLFFVRCVVKDLLFAYDGLQDYTQKSVNVVKIIKVSDIILSFTSNESPYLGIVPSADADLWALHEFAGVGDSDLDAWSRLIEPNDAESKVYEYF